VLEDPGVANLNLTFQMLSGVGGPQGTMSLTGTINNTKISGKSFITYIPRSVFAGTYTATDGSGTVTLANSSITFSDGLTVNTFIYDPVKRRFQFVDKDRTMRLYVNVASDVSNDVGAGSGLIIRFVQFISGQKGSGSTKVYLSNTKPVPEPNGPVVGAESLGTFAGYYPLDPVGSFLSITNIIGPKNLLLVGLCTDGKNSTQYSSFTFQNNQLTFPQPGAPSIKLDMMTDTNVKATATIVPADGSPVLMGQTYFSVAPLEAFGYRTLIGINSQTTTLTISKNDDGPSRIVFVMNSTMIFDTTEYEYNSVEQSVVYDDYRLNFCYNLKQGVTCGVTRTNVAHFNTVLFAYP